jgi:pimeloyl-ACP methyl ester carboxylesterase
MVTLDYSLGNALYYEEEVRRLLEGTDSGLLLIKVSRIQSTGGLDDTNLTGASSASAETVLRMLQQFARESGHPELQDVPLLFWGHSRAGNFGADFAALHPQRTIGFVLYQSAGGNREWARLTNTPVLLIGADNELAMWKRGRIVGEPWTFVREPDGEHGDRARFQKAHPVLFPWIAAVIRQRTSDGPTMRVITQDSGLLGNNETGEYAAAGAFAGSKVGASWLPDEPTARAWRAFLGK